MKSSGIFLSGMLLIGLASCQKESKQDQEPQKPETQSSEDIAMSMNYDEEITNLGQMSLEGNPTGKKSTSWLSCITYSIDTAGPTTEVTLDFGSTNCMGNDGRNRRGKLLVEFEDDPFDAGSVTTVTSSGYAINDHEITGSKSMTFMGLNTDGDPYFDLSTTLSIKKPNNKVITWNSTQSRVWTDGFGNLNPHDNAVEITGNANGMTTDSISYTLDILTALRAEATCSNIVSGSFKLSSPVFLDRTFDYGNGACDRIATVTVAGYTFTITL